MCRKENEVQGDVMSDVAMLNAYFICHNVQVRIIQLILIFFFFIYVQYTFTAAFSDPQCEFVKV